MKNVYLLLTKNVVEAQKYKLNWEEHLNRIQVSRLPISAYLHRQSQGTERLEDKEYNGRSSFRIAKYQNWLVAPTSEGEGGTYVFRIWQIVRNCKVMIM
jgi:hypothetical protein